MHCDSTAAWLPPVPRDRPHRRRLGIEPPPPILEMHRVVVRPLAAPDKAVSLEDRDDLGRYPIDVPPGSVPLPIIGVRRVDIDCGTPGVHARLARIGNGSAALNARAGGEG